MRVASEINELAETIRGFAEHVDGVALETDFMATRAVRPDR